jgi:DNA-binding protein HU-beta
MKEAQQLRWAKIRGESEPPAPATKAPSKAKRKLSKAGRANIVAALKKRWAAKKAAVKIAPTVAKKATAKKAPVKATKKATVKKPQKKAAKASEPPATPTAK